MKLKIETNETKTKELGKQITKTNEQVLRREKQLEEVKSQLISIEKELQTQTDRRSEITHKLKKSLAEINAAEVETKRLEGTLRSMENANQEKKDKIENQTVVNGKQESLQRELENEATVLYTAVEEKHSACEKLTSALEDLKQMQIKLGEELNKSTLKIEEIQVDVTKRSNKARVLEQERAVILSDIQSEKVKNNQLEEELLLLRSIGAQTVENIEEQHRSNAAGETRRVQLVAETSVLDANLEHAKTRFELLQQNIEDENYKYSTMTMKLAQLTLEAEEEEAKLKNKDAELLKLKKRLAEAEAETTNLISSSTLKISPQVTVTVHETILKQGETGFTSCIKPGDEREPSKEFRRRCIRVKTARKPTIALTNSKFSETQFESRLDEMTGRYNCTVCDAVLTNKSAFSRHKKIHSPNFDLKCRLCGLQHSRMDNLKRHLERHVARNKRNELRLKKKETM